MKNKLIIKLAIVTIASCLNSACSKDSNTAQSKTHDEFINETLKSPLCEITDVSFENGGRCKIRLQHTFSKTSENSYTVSTSSLDDCIDLSFDTLESNHGMTTVVTKTELNESLFNDDAIYYVEFSPDKRSADFIHSSQISKVNILKSYSALSLRFVPEGSETEDVTALSKSLCTSVSPEINTFCSSYHLDSLGRSAADLSSSRKEQVKLSIYNLLFKDNLCGTENRTTLYNAFLSEGKYL